MSSSLTSSVTALPGSKAAVSYARHGYLAVDCTYFESSQSELVLGELHGKDVQRVLSFAAITDVRSSPSLIHLLYRLFPVFADSGYSMNPFLHKIATQTSSVSLVFDSYTSTGRPSTGFTTQGTSLVLVPALEKILQRIECLEHLVIESRWRFSVKEDILRSLAVYAPKLRTLSLLKLRWFPLFTPPCHRKHPWKSDVADLVNVVILPSPCLDLSNLRYLAMSASSLRGALNDGQFPDLGKRVTHLTIMDLDGPAFHLHDYFPNISHLQLFVSNDGVLLQLLPEYPS
ncbi:hypothetical protein BT96DRAFT_943190 [Gymnopus androsaceus JB14]|uniref:Uncharacterized protein n=1 Tax=Gymnopus androsaceus JB14 TaxID=1447944 RepID=A0A6A4HAV7_9AGAR|nr:hypothetical protein BT96DRAFT_943190 [Gymnopus androsaceus JB14]